AALSGAAHYFLLSPPLRSRIRLKSTRAIGPLGHLRRGHMNMRAALVLAASLVVSHAAGVSGQGFQGGLRGAIKDAGGVIPGVEITLTNEQTNIKRSVVTNERGEYSFANVDPGTYSVKAALQGYKTVDRGGIRIGTQQFFTLDLTLEVGAITE